MHPLEGVHAVYAIVCASLSKSGVIDDNHAVKLHKLRMVKFTYMCGSDIYFGILFLNAAFAELPRPSCGFLWLCSVCVCFLFSLLSCLFPLLLLFNKLYLGSRRGRHHEVCWLCVCRSECAECEFFCLLCFSELMVRRDGQRESISKLRCLVGFDYI